MPNYSMRTFRATASETFDVFVNSYIYFGIVFKGGSNNYTHVMLYPNASNYPITAQKSTTSWAFSYLMTRDELNLDEDTITIDGTQILSLKKSGHVAQCYITNGSFTAANNGVVKYNDTTVTIPSKYRPKSAFRTNDDLSGIRLGVNTDGTITNYSGEAISNKALRMFATYLTA